MPEESRESQSSEERGSSQELDQELDQESWSVTIWSPAGVSQVGVTVGAEADQGRKTHRMAKARTVAELAKKALEEYLS